MAETNFSPRLGEVFEVSASQVNLFRSISSSGYAIGDIAITAAGATYEWDGDSWNSISFGAGGGGAQTPWASNINGGGFDLSSVRDITATRNIRADTIGVIDQEQVGDTDSEWYWKSELAGLSLYSDGSGGAKLWLTISDPEEGMTLQSGYTFHSDGFQGKEFLAINTLNATPFSIQGFSLTGANAQSAIDVSGTWNTSGTPTAFKLRVTDTASNAASLLLDLGTAAGSKFYIGKDGRTYTDGGYGAPGGYIPIYAGASLSHQLGIGYFNIVSSTAVIGLGNAPDVFITRDAANTLALRNGVNAQRARIYNTFTTLDTSGEWLKIDWQVTANQCRIGTVMGTSAGTARVLTFDYGALNAAPTAAITIPITSGNIVFGGNLTIGSDQVLGARRTGWSAATGGATRTTFDTATVTLPQLAERMKALVDDFLVHGAIGA